MEEKQVFRRNGVCKNVHLFAQLPVDFSHQEDEVVGSSHRRRMKMAAGSSVRRRTDFDEGGVVATLVKNANIRRFLVPITARV
jgi:hypothetical protein